MVRNPSNNIDAFRQFMGYMDLESLRHLLSDLEFIQDFRRDEFLSRLKLVFDEFETHGNTHLFSYPSVCAGCFEGKGKKAYVFKGNKTTHYIAFVIDHVNGTIKDAFECHSFKLPRKAKIESANRIFLGDKPLNRN